MAGPLLVCLHCFHTTEYQMALLWYKPVEQITISMYYTVWETEKEFEASIEKMFCIWKL